MDSGDADDQPQGSRRVRFAGVNDDQPTGDAASINKTPSINENRKLLDGGGGSQKDKLRRRNSGKGSAWTSSVHVPASDIPINSKSSRNMSRQSSNVLAGQTGDADIHAIQDMISPAGSLHRSPSRLAAEKTMSMKSKRLVREKNMEEEEDEDEDEEEESDGYSPGMGFQQKTQPAAAEEEEPVRMSLMSLLAETDEELESGGLAYMMDADDEDEDEDDEGGRGPAYHSCCVCMVKHKGAAFEPCGHSFCRLCSREMWVERGNCPLCNNYILEILDIF